MMIMEKYLSEARAYFQSLSIEELKSVLTKAGFNVRDGSGKIVLTESIKRPANKKNETPK
jgi:hypothetical protein